MNLPGSSIEFLDIFLNILPKEHKELPMIHCYTFIQKKGKYNSNIKDMKLMI
jgi:hypothetical protein